MRVAVITSPNPLPKTQIIVKKLIDKLISHQLTIDDNHPEVVITVGGDGTLLGAFHTYIEQIDRIRFVGLHTGHLGFYTDWLASELDDLVHSLVADNGQKIGYPLLKLTLEGENTQQSYLALNEATIKQPNGTLVADVYLSGRHFERFRGDGVSIATPSGSTAYNKANGGAILHPNIKAIQMSEIASINNRVYRTLGSPLIVPNEEVIEVRPSGSEYMITIDQTTIIPDHIKQLTFEVAKEQIYFAEYRHLDFWQRVHQSFIGDLN